MKLTCFVLIFLYCFLPLTFGSIKGSNSTGVQQATSKKETQRTQSPVSIRSSGIENPSSQTNQKSVKPTSSQSGSVASHKTAKPTSSQANQKTAIPPSSQSGGQANQKTAKPTSSQSGSQANQKTGKPLAPSNKPLSSLSSLKSKLPICSASSERIPTPADFTYGSNFFKSIELMDLLKALKDLADDNHGWAHPKVQSKRLAAEKILKKFRISEETKRLFNERPTNPLVKPPGRDLEKELHLICSQFAQMEKSKKLNYYDIAHSPDISKQNTATLGLTDVGSEVVEIGYCYNSVEPLVYIVLGPHVGNVKTFFLAIDFRDDDPNAREYHPTRRVLEHFHVTKSGKPKRIFSDISFVRDRIRDYKAVRDRINSENQRKPGPTPKISYFEGGNKEGAKADQVTIKLFGSLSHKTQPDFHTAGIDSATLSELCETIAAKGRYYYWKKSYEFYKDKEVYDTLYLFESRDKKDGIRRLGLCSYRMGDNIYVYLAKAERNHEEYLLAIKDKQLMVVVSNYQADISDEVVKF